MKILRILAWTGFTTCILFGIYQALSVYQATGVSANMVSIDFVSADKGKAMLQLWLNTPYDTNNLLHQAVLNTKVDCAYIICYVSVMFMLSYHQMQRKTWFPINNLLRLNLFLCFLTGLLDYIENGILFRDFRHTLTDQVFISPWWASGPKFLLAAWITGVWVAGFIVNRKTARYALALSLLSASTFSCAQPTGSPVSDAPLLRGYMQDPKVSAAKIMALISLYSGTTIKTNADLKTAISGNKFLAALATVPDLPADAEVPVTPHALIPALAQPGVSLATSVGGGIGTFIATRIKEEAETYFIQNMEAVIKQYPVLQSILPSTIKVLSNNDPSQLTTFLQVLGQALTKDVNNLPPDFEKYLETPGPDDVLLHDPSQLPYYYPVVFVYKTALQVRNLSSLITQVNSWSQSDDPLFGKMPADIRNYFDMVSILSNTLTDPSQTPASYFGAQALATAINGENSGYFTGLLLLQNQDALKKITFKISDKGNTDNLYDLINNLQQVQSLTAWISKAQAALAGMDAAFQNIQGSVSQQSLPVNPADIFNSIDALSKAMGISIQFPAADLGAIVDPCTTEAAAQVLSIAGVCAEIASDIENKSYGLVLTNIVSFLQQFGANSTALALITKYGNFAVTVMSAQSQDDVVSALENAAMPVGSYRVKRNSIIDVSLNAFGGVFAGTQIYPAAHLPDAVKNYNPVAGFTAPVGLAVSWGVSETKTKTGGQAVKGFQGSSNSVLLTVIDVGAVTAFRLENDATSTLPDFTWANILAPGLYWVHGIKNCPLSYGVGGQYGPQLRSINSTTTTTTVSSAWSVRAFLAIDIPVFDFYSKSE